MGNPAITKKDTEEQRSLADEAPDALDYAARKRAQPRCKYGFTFNDKVRQADRDPKKIVLVELTAGEEEMAFKVGGDNKFRVSEELVLASLWSVDGKRVNVADDEARFYWARWSPRVRKQALIAWQSIHTTDEEEDQSFLASRTPEL